MRKPILLLVLLVFSAAGYAQKMSPGEVAFKKDSTLKARMHADSVAVNKEFARKEKMARILEDAQYPLIKSAEWGIVLPVDNPTEIPDANQQYKLLFEITVGNRDSLRGEIDENLAEVARVINLHIASGIPVKNIVPVIIAHGTCLNAFRTNEAFKKKYGIDNPNMKLLDEFRAIGTRFIACGQAMQFFDVPKDALQPDVKISLTAQTVLTNYQLKGYVLKRIMPD